MIGRTLTERLLATTSLAALALAALPQDAQATACSTVVGAGAAYSNSGAVNCVMVNTTSASVTNQLGGTIGPSHFSGGAIIVTGSGTLTGGIVNSGTIIGASGGTTNSVGIGIAGVVQGGINNSGTISFDVAHGLGNYHGTGISINAASFGGGIANSSTISGTVVTNSAAEAAGIYANVGTFTGGLVNNGTISAGGTGTSDVTAYGVSISVNTFTGSIINNGTISAAATASGTAYASATGLTISADSFIGGIVNNGVISATATSSSNCCGAAAAAISIDAGTFTGGIVNNGAILATATAAANCGCAHAIGIRIFADTFNGGITNAGSIVATATNSGSDATFATGIYASFNSFGGGIANSGVISGTATASGDGYAQAYGIYLSGSLFTGGLTNSGTISATAIGTQTYSGSLEATGVAVSFVSTFIGGIANSGLISATATNASHCCGAAAVAIAITGVSTFAGGIVNMGTLRATATAASCCNSAHAAGLVVSVSNFSGGITNAGAIIATATNTENAGAYATGLGISVSTFGGNIVNSGMIAATATDTHGGVACAYALGINGGFSGTLTNSGSIIATATSSNGGYAIGIAVSATSFTGKIVNSGTIAGMMVGTGTGIGIRVNQIGAGASISNTGTIQGSTWAINDSSDSHAVTINQNGGTIIGGTGGAIDLGANGDILNITGGSIVGNIVGNNASATTGNVVNVAMGAGTFAFASNISNVGVVNLNSGTLLLQNIGGGVGTTNYNQAAGATLALEVQNVTNTNASLAASAAITLAAGSQFEAFEGAFNWTPGTTYTYANVVTGASITGTFAAALSNSPFFTASLTQTATADSLTLTMLTANSVPGLSSDQKSVAAAIMGIPGGNGTLDEIYELNATQLNQALTQLSGAQYTQGNYQPLLNAWQTFTDTLSNRLSIGEGYSGTMTGSYDLGDNVKIAQASTPERMSDAGPNRFAAPAGPWGAWMRGYGMTASAPSTGTTAPYTEAGAGVIFGADKQMTDQLVAGAAFNLGTDKATSTGGGSTLSNSYQGSAYAQYKMDANWYIDGLAGFGWQTYKSLRVVTLLAPTYDNGSFSGQSYRAYGETGYALHPAFLAEQSFRLTPYLGAGYLHTHTGAFTENGPTALSVQAMDANSFTTTLGARAAMIWRVGDNAVFKPEIRAGWQHEWLDASATVHSTFAQSPSSVMTATGSFFSRESFVGGAGITTAIDKSTQLFVDYDAKVNGGYVAQVISGGFRVDF